MVCPKSEKIKLIYIGPVGRSGSTLLDMIFGVHPDIESVGEIINYSEWFQKDLKCSCGEQISQCSYWCRVRTKLSEIMEEPEKLKINFVPKFEQYLNILRFNSVQQAQKYGYYNYILFKSILSVTKRNIIWDSSKDIDRLIYLYRSGYFDIKVIHLVRDGRGTINSMSIPRMRLAVNPPQTIKPQSSLKASVRWTLNHLRMLRFKNIISNDKYLLVRYEDLATNPQDEIERIYKSLKLEIPEPVIQIKKDNHNIGGNRMRYNDEIKIKLDEKWRKQLKAKDKRIFQIIGGFLNRRFGYNI